MARSRGTLIRCLGLLALTVQTCALPLVSQAPVDTFALTVTLAEQLDAIADTATAEAARCLYGKTTPGRVLLDQAFEPKVILATWMTYNGGPCPGEPLAFWHVHIAHDFTIMGTRSGRDRAPQDYCFLSRPDILSSVTPNDPPIQLVGVGHRLLCWWTRREIAARVRLDSLPLVLWPESAAHLVRLPDKAH